MTLGVAVVAFLACCCWPQPVVTGKKPKSFCLALVCASNTARGLSNLDDIRGNGSLLVKVAPDYAISHNFIMFPTLKFNCDGEIKKVKYLAMPRNGTRPYFSFGLGQLKEYYGTGTHYHVKFQRSTHIGGSGTRFELSYQSGSMSFKSGDIFAVNDLFINHELLFFDDKTEIERCIGHMRRYGYVSCNASSGNKPLVAIETGKLANNF